MAWTTPRTFVAGEVETAAIFNTHLRDNLNHIYGSTWTTFSPTLTQSGSVALTTAVGRYQYVGYRCHLHCFLVANAAGTVSNDVVVGAIPAAIAPRTSGALGTATVDLTLGNGTYHDISVGLYGVQCFFASSSTLKLYIDTNTSGAMVGTGPAFAVAAGDSLRIDMTYETASAST